MKKWTDFLSEEVYNRLAHCRSTKADILPLAKAQWTVLQHEEGFTPESALNAILGTLERNGCDFDLTKDEYNDILSCIH